jgi:O-antigen/teichoic acid export membrane protein
MKRFDREVGETPAEPARPEPLTGLWPFPGLGGRLRAPGSFARSVLTLMTGTTLANVIPILAAPVLARLYSPADFGVFALYSATVALLAVAATARYELAVVLPAADEDALELLGLSLLLSLGAAALCALAVLVFGPTLLARLETPGLAGWLWLLPPGVLLVGMSQALGNWLNRRRAYPRIAASRVLQAAAAALLAIALARAGTGAGGLVLGSIAGQASATALLALAAWQDIRGRGLRVTAAGMKRQAARYREFPRVNALHALLDNLNVTASVVLLTHYFGSVTVGHYAMVMRVLMAPVALVGSAISQVFYQRAADAHNRGESLSPLIRTVLARSAWIALPAALALLVAAPALFRLAFGPEWSAAGDYARLLSPYMLLHFLAAPLAFVPLVLGRQAQSLLVSTVGNLLSLGCIVAGGWRGAPGFAFGALSLVVGAFFVAYIGWIVRLAARPGGRAA